MELIVVTKAAAEQAERDRVLMDLRGVEGQPKEMDRFYAGQRVAQVFGFRIKVAVVARREVINKFGENTAVNEGARLNVVSSEPDAGWKNDDPQPRVPWVASQE
jgi:hypothetical protein